MQSSARIVLPTLFLLSIDAAQGEVWITVCLMVLASGLSEPCWRACIAEACADLAPLPVQLKVSGKYATSRFTQLVALARKFRLAYWRSPSYNLMRMLMTLLISLFYGSVFWRRGQLPSQGAPQRCAALRRLRMLACRPGVMPCLHSLACLNIALFVCPRCSSPYLPQLGLLRP